MDPGLALKPAPHVRTESLEIYFLFHEKWSFLAVFLCYFQDEHVWKEKNGKNNNKKIQ